MAQELIQKFLDGKKIAIMGRMATGKTHFIEHEVLNHLEDKEVLHVDEEKKRNTPTRDLIYPSTVDLDQYDYAIFDYGDLPNMMYLISYLKIKDYDGGVIATFMDVEDYEELYEVFDEVVMFDDSYSFMIVEAV